MENRFDTFESAPGKLFFSHALPAILSMVLTSGIVVVDGLFIGNIIGGTGLAAVNLTLPLLYFFLGLALMIGVGGAVKAGHALGAGQTGRASRYFSLTLGLAGILISAGAVLCLICLDGLTGGLNTDPGLEKSVAAYLGTILWFYPAMMMNIIFAIFIRTQGRPGLSLVFGIGGNLLNLLLDWLMIPVWGLAGAAMASGISVLIPMGCGILYFLSDRSPFNFVRFSWDPARIWEVLFNGASEMVGQISIGITTWVFNLVLLSRMGVDGVAVYTIAGYAAFVQFMVVTGLAIGLGPIVIYYFGAGKSRPIGTVTRIALKAACLAGLVCWAALALASSAVSAVFAPGNEALRSLAVSAFPLFSSAFLFNGFNILAIAWFTAVGQATISFVLSCLRGLVLVNGFVLILPLFLGDTGIWLAWPLAEIITLAVAAPCLRAALKRLPGQLDRESARVRTNFTGMA